MGHLNARKQDEQKSLPWDIELDEGAMFVSC